MLLQHSWELILFAASRSRLQDLKIQSRSSLKIVRFATLSVPLIIMFCAGVTGRGLGLLEPGGSVKV